MSWLRRCGDGTGLARSIPSGSRFSGGDRRRGRCDGFAATAQSHQLSGRFGGASGFASKADADATAILWKEDDPSIRKRLVDCFDIGAAGDRKAFILLH